MSRRAGKGVTRNKKKSQSLPAALIKEATTARKALGLGCRTALRPGLIREKREKEGEKRKTKR